MGTGSQQVCLPNQWEHASLGRRLGYGSLSLGEIQTQGKTTTRAAPCLLWNGVSNRGLRLQSYIRFPGSQWSTILLLSRQA